MFVTIARAVAVTVLLAVAVIVAATIVQVPTPTPTGATGATGQDTATIIDTTLADNGDCVYSVQYRANGVPFLGKVSEPRTGDGCLLPMEYVRVRYDRVDPGQVTLVR